MKQTTKKKKIPGLNSKMATSRAVVLKDLAKDIFRFFFPPFA